MAQRSFPCTSCGANIEVPDDYFEAQIACPACQARHHRLTGKPARLMGQAHAARAPYPQAPMAGAPQGPMPHHAPWPRPGAAPYPGAYPQMFAPMGPPPKSSNKGLWIGLGIAGGVLMLFVAVIVAIPLIAGASVDLDDSSGWYEYTSEAGGYSVKFPGRPEVETETLTNGVRVSGAECVRGEFSYYVAFFDLASSAGARGQFSPARGFDAIAERHKAWISKMEPATVCGKRGSKGILENVKGYRAEVITFVVGTRVYLIGCARLSGERAINLPTFVDTFRLTGARTSGEPDGTGSPDGATELSYLKVDAIPVARQGLAGVTQIVTGSVSGGSPPFIARISPAADTPPVFYGRDRATAIHITQSKPGRYEYVLTVTDANNDLAECRFVVEFTEVPANWGDIVYRRLSLTDRDSRSRVPFVSDNEIVLVPYATVDVAFVFSKDPSVSTLALREQWSYSNDKLPQGLMFRQHSSDLYLSGTPMEFGTCDFTVKVTLHGETGLAPRSIEKSYRLKVMPYPDHLAPSTVGAVKLVRLQGPCRVGKMLRLRAEFSPTANELATAGEIAEIQWAFEGLPPGLAAKATNALAGRPATECFVEGVPTQAGSYEVKVVVTVKLRGFTKVYEASGIHSFDVAE